MSTRARLSRILESVGQIPDLQTNKDASILPPTGSGNADGVNRNCVGTHDNLNPPEIQFDDLKEQLGLKPVPAQVVAEPEAEAVAELNADGPR